MLTKLYKPRKFDKERGFTLIELLVVIVIIGILAAIALPIFLNQQKAAMNATVQSDARNSVIGVRAALVKTPDAGGFTLLHAGDTASYALIQSPLVHAAVVPVPAGNVGVYMVETKDNVSVITDVAHEGSNALANLSSAAPNWQSWVVHSENKLTGYWYEFDSTTGKYTDGTKTPVGSAYVPDATMNGGSGGGTGGTGGTGGGTNGSNAQQGEIVATSVAYGGPAGDPTQYVAFDSPVVNGTSDWPWAKTVDISTEPFGSPVTDLHLYVGTTEVPLVAEVPDQWFADVYNYGGPEQIEFAINSGAELLSDVNAAGFTMDQFYTQGKIVGTINGVPNNVMYLNISSVGAGTPAPGFGNNGGNSGAAAGGGTGGNGGTGGGNAGTGDPNYGTTGTLAQGFVSSSTQMPANIRNSFSLRNSGGNAGSNATFAYSSGQDARIGNQQSGPVQIVSVSYTNSNGTVKNLTINNLNSYNVQGNITVNNGFVYWSLAGQIPNGQVAPEINFTDSNGNQNDPLSGTSYADLVFGYNSGYGTQNPNTNVVWGLKFPGATANFYFTPIVPNILN